MKAGLAAQRIARPDGQRRLGRHGAIEAGERLLAVGVRRVESLVAHQDVGADVPRPPFEPRRLGGAHPGLRASAIDRSAKPRTVSRRPCRRRR